MNSINLVLDKINERDPIYEQTWKMIPVADLIAQARIKTFRATTMLSKNNKEKLLDDLIDGAAYLLFAIERLLSDASSNYEQRIEYYKKQIEQDKKQSVTNSTSNLKIRADERPKKRGRPPIYSDDITWYDLTSKMCYTVKDGKLLIAYRVGDKLEIKSKFDMEKIGELYKQLPEKSTSKDIKELCEKIGLEIRDPMLTYLMHIFARYIEFGGEIVRDGNKIILIKDDYSLSDEIEKLREIEKSTIGTPYSVRD